MLAAESPASFVAWDLLALGDEDLRETPQGERRARLEAVLGERRAAGAPDARRRGTARPPPTGSIGSRAPGSTASSRRRLDGPVPAGQAGDAQDQAPAHGRLRRRGVPLAQERSGHPRRVAAARACSTTRARSTTSGSPRRSRGTRARRWPRSSRRCASGRSTTTPGASGPSGRRPATPMPPASGCPARRRAGTAARTCRGSRSGRSASSRSPTTTSRAIRFRHGTTFKRWRPDKPPAACRYDQLETSDAVSSSRRSSGADASERAMVRGRTPVGPGSGPCAAGPSAHGWPGQWFRTVGRPGRYAVQRRPSRVRHASKAIATDAAHPGVRRVHRARRDHGDGAGRMVGAHFSAATLNDVVSSDAATTRAFVNAYVRPADLAPATGSRDPGREPRHPTRLEGAAGHADPSGRDPARRAPPAGRHDRRRERPGDPRHGDAGRRRIRARRRPVRPGGRDPPCRDGRGRARSDSARRPSCASSCRSRVDGKVLGVVGIWRDAVPILERLASVRRDVVLVTLSAALIAAALLFLIFRAAQRRLTPADRRAHRVDPARSADRDAQPRRGGRSPRAGDRGSARGRPAARRSRWSTSTTSGCSTRTTVTRPVTRRCSPSPACSATRSSSRWSWVGPARTSS